MKKLSKEQIGLIAIMTIMIIATALIVLIININNPAKLNPSIYSKEDAVLEKIEYKDNRINVYFFWGNGCPHCEKEFQAWQEINQKYGKLFKIHTFEVWENEDNQLLLLQFSEAMGEYIDQVPYTIIGDKTFSGYSDELKDQLIDAIVSQSNNSFDVYFEKIK